MTPSMAAETYSAAGTCPAAWTYPAAVAAVPPLLPYGLESPLFSRRSYRSGGAATGVGAHFGDAGAEDMKFLGALPAAS